jgi:hypothetical protein
MSTPQEYWDACLIRTWRQAGTVFDVIKMFTSITKIKYNEVDPKLLRIPDYGFPWKLGVRVYTARHLSKISKRLWEQSLEKDVALLHKLKESKYDTEKDVIHDKELRAESKKLKQNIKLMELIKGVSDKRNEDTDWKTVKTPSSRPIRRK